MSAYAERYGLKRHHISANTSEKYLPFPFLSRVVRISEAVALEDLQFAIFPWPGLHSFPDRPSDQTLGEPVGNALV